MTNEQNLLILLTRLSFDNKTLKKIEETIDEGVNWFELFKLALYHKTATLCWINIRKYFPDVSLPIYLAHILQCAYIGTKQRNIYLQKELANVKSIMEDNGIIAIPVKGAMLIPEMYKDYGIRYSSDIDFLIKYEDLKKLEKILQEKLGYIQGIYNYNTKQIEPVQRSESIKWKIFMSNLFPYCKIVQAEDGTLEFVGLDYRFALDDERHYEVVNEIVDFYEKKRTPKIAHILLHLCTHFYDEAKHEMTIALYKDMNLIKLCDIREYIYQFVSDNDWTDLIQIAQKYGLEKQIYFTVYWLSMIYDDGYEKQILNRLKINETFFLETFGKNTIDNQKQFRSTNLERLFSCDNTLELKPMEG